MKDGFIKKNFGQENLAGIEKILSNYHQKWLVKNESAFKNGAINSAYITNGDFLSPAERLELLKFVSSSKVVNEARKVLGHDICFLNTQIFFNPYSEQQKNYWHRDIQYTGQSEDQQRKVIEAKDSQVIHLRLALADENGIEFIPGSHFRWDTPKELNVRLKRDGESVFNDLQGSEQVPLKKGDLLIFDANIIHRGLYGQSRFAFDILFCKSLPEITKYISSDTLPKKEELGLMECPEVFKLSIT
nr:phytanoyl-CoA dioxygenase family protein [Bacteriovorax sp. HI3]